jgi:hypothetical protein
MSSSPASSAAIPAPYSPAQQEGCRKDQWDVSGGSAFNQNRDGGVQQLVIIENEDNERWKTRPKNKRRHGTSDFYEADGEDESPLGFGPYKEGTLSQETHLKKDWVVRGLIIAGVTMIGLIFLILLLRRRDEDVRGYYSDGDVFSSSAPDTMREG